MPVNNSILQYTKIVYAKTPIAYRRKPIIYKINNKNP
jgi:hypothetical protein